MRVLVFQHIPVEHPGIFREFLTADGFAWDVVEWDTGDTAPPHRDYDALWVMGGPMDVWEEEAYPWLVAEKQAIRDWVEAGKPVLGICLGHQLLADAFGGRVVPMAAGEVGVMHVELSDAGVADPLFAGFERHATCLQWHSSEVVEMPAGAVSLAASPEFAYQAFRLGKTVYGLQYHVEVTDETVGDWASVPAYAASLQAEMGEGGVATFDAAVGLALPALNAGARRLYDNFKKLV